MLVRYEESSLHWDSRGYFFEAFRECSSFQVFVQDNVSCSHKGVIRGLHYQKDPCAQGKLVRCLSGSIYDVAVDLKTGEWVAKVLDDSHKSLYIPPGFAHGFQALEASSLIYYKCTKEYSPEHEAGIDPLSLGINWPIADYMLSEKDAQLPKFTIK